MKAAKSVLACIILTFTTSAAVAQSLADVARREAERRGTASKGGKVYTNRDLTADFTTPVAPASETAGPAEASTADEREAVEPADGEREGTPAVQAEDPTRIKDNRGEDYWRERALSIRGRVDVQRARVVSLKTRVTALAGAETAADVLERDLATKALLKAQSDLTFFEQDLAAFEATVKEKNIPAAWLR